MNTGVAKVLDEPLRPGTHYRTEFFKATDTINTRGLVVDVGGRDGRALAELGVAGGVLVDVEVVPRSPAVSYVAGSGTDIPLRDGCADTVLALDVIEHIDDEQRFVTELVRLLAPGGQLVLTTPSIDIRVLPGRAQKKIDQIWGHHRVRGYDPSHLAELLRNAGADDVEVRSISMRAYRVGYLPMRALWQVWPRGGRAVVSAMARTDAGAKDARHGFVLATAGRRA